MDATLVTARSDKEGAAATWKKGYGFHPLGAWCRNTRECLAMLLRSGNAGSNTFADHKEVLAAALKQVPSRFRRKILVRVDGAGASHDLVEHLYAGPAAERREKVLETLTRMFGPEAARPEGWFEKDWTADPWTRGCYFGLPARGAISRRVPRP